MAVRLHVEDAGIFLKCLWEIGASILPLLGLAMLDSNKWHSHIDCVHSLLIMNSTHLIPLLGKL